MAKFGAIALTVAGVATVVVISMAASAAASTFPFIITATTTGFSESASASPSPSITPSEGPSISPSPRADPSADPNAITADIYVALGFPDSDGPMEFRVSGVVVGDGIELTGADITANPNEYCADATVDISLNPSTITVTGGEEYCDFQEAYVEVTLHGVEFGSVTLNSDTLFAPDSDSNPAMGLSGGSYKARSIPMSSTDPYPVLDSYGVSGSTFSAYWSGDDSSGMTGSSVFNWVPLARAGSGAAADPSFTG